MIRRRTVFVLIFVFLAGVLCACSSGGGGAKRPQGVNPPTSSPLAKVKEGMSDEEVRRVIGSPTSSNHYTTGKAWIPYFYGSDTSRSDWKYKGMGRIVFSRNRYSGGLKVIRVDYDPGEPGR